MYSLTYTNQKYCACFLGFPQLCSKTKTYLILILVSKEFFQLCVYSGSVVFLFPHLDLLFFCLLQLRSESSYPTICCFFFSLITIKIISFSSLEALSLLLLFFGNWLEVSCSASGVYDDKIKKR